MIQHSLTILVEKLNDYHGLADYLIFDLSGGEGRPLSIDYLRSYLRAAREAGFNFGLGVAGGLGPNTLSLVEPLVVEFPNLSIDAESQLRDANDNLDLNKTQEYLAKAIQLFTRRR